MWKFLSALNLVSVMFISGCNKKSSDFKEYNLEFPEILNISFTHYPKPKPSGYIGYISVISFQNQLPFNLRLDSFYGISDNNIAIFFRNNGTKDCWTSLSLWIDTLLKKLLMLKWHFLKLIILMNFQLLHSLLKCLIN